MMSNPSRSHLSKTSSYLTFQDGSSCADGELDLQTPRDTPPNNLRSQEEHTQFSLKKKNSSRKNNSATLSLDGQNKTANDIDGKQNGKCTDCIFKCTSLTVQKVKSAIKVRTTKKSVLSQKKKEKKGRWKEVWDQKLMCHYFINQSSKEITYDMTPYCESRSCILYETAVFTESYSSRSNHSSTNSDNRSKESSVRKPSQLYYYNIETRESFWEIPTAIWRPVVILLSQQPVDSHFSKKFNTSHNPLTRQLYHFNVLTAEYTMNSPDDPSTIIPSHDITNLNLRARKDDSSHNIKSEMKMKKTSDENSSKNDSKDSYSTVQFDLSTLESRDKECEIQNVVDDLQCSEGKENSSQSSPSHRRLKSTSCEKWKGVDKLGKNKTSKSCGWTTRSDSSIASDATMTTTSTMTVTTEESENQQIQSYEDWEELYERQMVLFNLLNHHCPNNKVENLKFISFTTSQNNILTATANVKKIIEKIPYDALSYYIIRYINASLPSPNLDDNQFKEKILKEAMKKLENENKYYKRKKNDLLVFKTLPPAVDVTSNDNEQKNNSHSHDFNSPTKSISFEDQSFTSSSLSLSSHSSESSLSSFPSACLTSSQSSSPQSRRRSSTRKLEKSDKSKSSSSLRLVNKPSKLNITEEKIESSSIRIHGECVSSASSSRSTTRQPKQPLLQISNDGTCFSLYDDKINKIDTSFQSLREINKPAVITPNLEDLNDLPFDQASDLSLSYSLSPPMYQKKTCNLLPAMEGNYDDDDEYQDSPRPQMNTSKNNLGSFNPLCDVGQTSDTLTPDKSDNSNIFTYPSGLTNYLQNSQKKFLDITHPNQGDCNKDFHIPFRNMNLNFSHNPYNGNKIESSDEEEHHQQQQISDNEHILQEPETYTPSRGRRRERQW